MDYHAVRIHLIRHEKTRANFESKYIGWTDEPIVTRPILFTNLKPTVVYGSDLLRCQQTAEMYFPDVHFVADTRLREMNFGQYEMKTYSQLKDIQHYRNWIDAPEQITVPNGESFQQFKQRVVEAFQSIVVKPAEYYFVVHGGVIRMMLYLFGPTEKSFQQITAQHRTHYSLQWSQLQFWKDGLKCTSFSEEPLMVKDNM